MKAEQSTAMAFIDNKVSEDKSTITHIEDIGMKDIIVVDKEDGIFKGLRYKQQVDTLIIFWDFWVIETLFWNFEIFREGQRYLSKSWLRFLDHFLVKNADYY